MEGGILRGGGESEKVRGHRKTGRGGCEKGQSAGGNNLVALEKKERRGELKGWKGEDRMYGAEREDLKGGFGKGRCDVRGDERMVERIRRLS